MLKTVAMLIYGVLRHSTMHFEANASLFRHIIIVRSQRSLILGVIGCYLALCRQKAIFVKILDLGWAWGSLVERS